MRGYDEDFSGTLAPTRPQRFMGWPPLTPPTHGHTQQLVLHNGAASPRLDCFPCRGAMPALRGGALRRCRPRTCAPLLSPPSPVWPERRVCVLLLLLLLLPRRVWRVTGAARCSRAYAGPVPCSHLHAATLPRCCTPHCARACVPVCLACAVADADAALTYPVRAGELKKGSYVVIQGHPCKVRKGCRAPRRRAGSPASVPAGSRPQPRQRTRSQNRAWMW
jgi:hypothetical protein